jgi:endo-1,4-beta-xylanase
MTSFDTQKPLARRASRRSVLAGALALAACGRRVEALTSGQIAAYANADLRLRPVPALPRSGPTPALRDLSDLPIGVCFNPDFTGDPGYTGLVARQFSQLTPEWNFQMPAVLQPDGSYDWSRADQIVDFARAHGQRIHATSLVWYEMDDTPLFRALDGQPDAFAAAYRGYIMTIVGRFRGAAGSWDVINEAVTEQGDGLRDSLWSRNLGPEDYMVRAFDLAAEADPDAILFINDFGLELVPDKRATFMRLVDRLRARGCKVGGVGTQTHLNVDVRPGMVTAALNDLASLGLPIHISEFDVGFGPARASALTTDQKLGVETELAAETIAAFLALPRPLQYAFTTWGARDRDSNLNRPNFGGDGTDMPLLFNDEGAPKPAFWAIADRLAARA